MTDTTTEVILYGDGFELLPLGLKITGNPSYDEWKRAGYKLWEKRRSIQWAVGDWLCYGEGRGDFGETYTQAIDQTQYSVQTLQNFAWVSGRIEISRRREKLSWSHHEIVAALDPQLQDKLLDLAIQMGWSRDDLRDEVKRLKPTLANETPTTSPATPQSVLLPPGDEDEGEHIATVRVAVAAIRSITELGEQLAAHELDDSEMVIIKVFIPDTTE